MQGGSEISGLAGDIENELDAARGGAPVTAEAVDRLSRGLRARVR